MLRRQLLAEATGHDSAATAVPKTDLFLEERVASWFSSSSSRRGGLNAENEDWKRTPLTAESDANNASLAGASGGAGDHLGGSGSGSPAASPWKRVKDSLPLFDQLKRYTWKHATDDLVAGATVAFVLLPQSIAYANLALADPYQALICASFPPLLYAIFGASRQLSIGPEALVSVIVGGVIANELENTTDFTASQIGSTLALIVGLLAIVLAALRAGFIDNILSGYLLTGFVLGVAVLIMVEQLPDLLGLDAHLTGDDSTISKLVTTLHALGSANKWAVTIAVLNVAFLLTFREFKKRVAKMSEHATSHPSPPIGNSDSKQLTKNQVLRNKIISRAPEILILVIIMVFFSWLMNFGANGIKILGLVDTHFRAPTLPPVRGDLINRLVQPSITILLVGFIECQTVTKDFGSRHGYFPSADQELFTFGMINFVTSFFGAYPTFGSLPRSRINATSGARTTLASTIAGIVVFIAFLTLVPALQYLPRATLASIVFVAALGLIETKEIAFVLRLRAWSEIAMFLTTLIITLVFSISVGILLCLGLSALLIVRRTTVTSMSVMGRLHYSHASTANEVDRPSFVSIDEHNDAELLEGVILLRVDVPLLFYNCGQARRSIEAVMQAERRVMLASARRRAAAAAAAGVELDEITIGGGSFGMGIGGAAGTGSNGSSPPRPLSALVVGNGEGSSSAAMGDEPPVSPGAESDDEDEGVDARRWGALHSWRKNRARMYVSTNAAPPSPVPSSSASSIASSNKHLLESPDVIESPDGDVVGMVVVQTGGAAGATDAPVTSSVSENYIGPHTIVLDMRHCIDLDSAATFVLRRIIKNFRRQGVRIVFCGLHNFQRVLFQRAGLAPVLLGNVFEDMYAAVADVESKLEVVDWRRDD